ncbi:MAG TPA: DUF1178 family protein [Ramlibacter sp.]|jgi:hypothetical protein|uniref:DUF1178 family protein n=1 Tax=Ramlibacter sp. TaxID=1917967 RepID=UPI002D410128|nr:DUF1178 family protein [Ramlibacter sp.]HZY19560.1 DUF1178 family protein [Ramlibacter sp.]
MKVLNLQCTHRHVFEGWFGSEDDFQDQLGRQLVECPMCGDTAIAKLPSAPRLNLGAQPQPTSSAPATARQDVAAAPEAALQQAWLKMVQHVMASTEDVGERFAEEARRIHYGESEDRGIRGQASREETEALLEEGIAVLPLPIPKALKGPVQ